MKISKDGKELKNAKVLYFASGIPAHVEIEGRNYDVSAFELKDDEPVKKTRVARNTVKKADTTETKPADGIMSTADVETKADEAKQV